MSIKVEKYRLAGVREYWLVDLEHRRVIIHDYEQNDLVNVYTFDDKVPVSITSGDLQIDFAEIRDYLNELFGEQW